MAQTPKEKARELVDKFYPRATSFSLDRKNQNENAKECALIAVDEAKKCTKYENQKFENDRFSEDYWTIVELEVDRLERLAI